MRRTAPTLRTLKLAIEYDGSRYFGFQRQKHHPTIQGSLEAAARKLFQKKISVVGAGRTDSGAHAEGQVAHMKAVSKLPCEKIKRGLNHYLPKDIAVLEVKEASPNFHARFSAKSKVYEYRIVNSSTRAPLELGRSYQVYEPLNLKAMREAARILRGRHDFRAFEASGGKPRHSIRTTQRFQIQKKGKIISFTIRSNGFLYKMVRSVVGTLLEVGSGRLKLSGLKQILATKDRSLVGPTVPARGLTLKRVMY